MSGGGIEGEAKGQTTGAEAQHEPCGCSCGREAKPGEASSAVAAENDAKAAHGSSARAGLVRRGLALEYLTVGWNIVEGIVSVAAAVAASSVALLGFGIDSFVETTSGLILI
nr:hypothetical protein [Rhodoglobus sp.]